MEQYYLVSIILIPTIITIFILLKLTRNFSRSKKLPPGPTPWPIIGNIHELGALPHVSLANLSKKYGPLMSLKLGGITTIVISSSQIAKDMFTHHDLALSSRRIPHAVTAMHHDKLSLVWLPVSPKWRDMRKIITIQLFTAHCLDSSEALRRVKVDELVVQTRKCCQTGVGLEIGKAGFTTSLNLLSNTFFSMDLSSHDSSSSQEFRDIACHLLEEVALPNVSDFFPVMKWFDLQGVKKRMVFYMEKMMGAFGEIIDQRLRDEMGGNKDDVLGYLLKLVNDNELSLDEVKHLLVDLFVAGTETTSNTVEWAMTELLRSPEKMAKAQEEVDKVIGKNGRVKESDICKLPYIQAIVKETFRLHPPGAFLIPHKADKDVELCGYNLPKNAQILVHIWSIGRDPSVWPNPMSFMPERFVESEIDTKGLHFELIPFGAGRRICPGIPLADRMVHLMLATLLHAFHWKNADGDIQDLDVEEKFALSLQKAKPLRAIPLLRQYRDNV